VEIAPVKTILKRITKPVQTKINIATAPSFVGGNRLLKNLESNIQTTEDNAKFIEENNKKVKLKFDSLQDAWLKGDIE